MIPDIIDVLSDPHQNWFAKDQGFDCVGHGNAHQSIVKEGIKEYLPNYDSSGRSTSKQKGVQVVVDQLLHRSLVKGSIRCKGKRTSCVPFVNAVDGTKCLLPLLSHKIG